MNRFFKSAVAAAAAITLTAVSLTASASDDNPCDLNGNGRTDIADAVLIMNYVGGHSDVDSPELADFDHDGFVTKVDATRLQEWLLNQNNYVVNPPYTSGPTDLRNSNVGYFVYNATTGVQIDTQTVEQAADPSEASPRSIIGTDDLYTGDYHKGLCKIKTSKVDGTDVKEYTGFVSSDDTIMTAAQALYKRKIVSIQFFNSSGNVILNANATDFRIHKKYKDAEGTFYDYALINVSNDLSEYKTFEMGYALDWAIESEANVSISGFKKDSITSYTGDGRIKNSGTAKNELMYSCDAVDGMVGAPIFRDVVHNGSHHYVVVGINTSDNSDNNSNNSGVRICPNITNLVRNN